jgi:hypothetical protein
MQTNFRSFILFLLFFFAFQVTQAQLTGTISIPNSIYPDLNSAVAALNVQGVGTGGVVINLLAGNPQVAPAGGYQIGSATLNASVNATNNILFKGNGNTITAHAGTGSMDGIFIIAGLDYLTVDSLNLLENSANTSAASQMEWGYALLKRNTSIPYDGCRHVTIRNCHISLGLAGDFSTGIYMNNHTPVNSSDIDLSGATEADVHSYNSFSGNRITNCNWGISVEGPSGFLKNHNNSVGIPIGNKITIGGAGAFYTAGIKSVNDSILTIKNNDFYISATHNPVDSGINDPLVMGARVTGAKGKIEVEQNLFNLSSTTGNNVGVIGCLMENADDSNGHFSFSKNKITGTNLVATGFLWNYFFGLECLGVNYDSIKVDHNIVDSVNWGGNSSLFCNWRGFYIRPMDNGTFPVNVTLDSNSVSNIEVNYQWTAYLFNVSEPSGSTAIHLSSNGNKIHNVDIKSKAFTGFEYDADTTYAANNSMQNIKAGGNFVGAVTLGGYTHVTNDTISKVKCNRFFTGFNGMAIVDKTCIADDSAMMGFKGMTNVGIASGNLITRLYSGSANANLIGIEDAEVCYNNFISDFSAPAYNSDDMYGIYAEYPRLTKIYHNTIKLSPLSAGSNFGATGIWYSSGATLDLRNNIICVDAHAAGSGIVAALRREAGISGTQPYNFSNLSNGNIYYAPDTTNSYLYAEGVDPATIVNAYNLSNDPDFNTNCGAFKTFVQHDYQSYTEFDLVPAALPGTYRPQDTSYAESRVSTSIVTNDFQGVMRLLPADAGALEFDGIYLNASDITSPGGAAMTFCTGDSILLYAPAGNGFSYQWQQNGININGATYSFLTVYTGGIYSLIYSKGSCTDTTAADTVTALPLPVPVIVANNHELSVVLNYNTYQWLRNNEIINGAVNSTYTVLSNGNYRVVVSLDNGCSDTSAIQFVGDITGIADPSLVAGMIRIYPNPVMDVLHVSSPAAVDVKVTNMEGRYLRSIKNARSIPVADLSQGIYLVHISDKNGLLIKVEKFVKRNND